MKHICYSVNSTDPAPAGDGDAKSWFEFYKWKAEGEQFVPVKHDHFKGFINAEPGDFLWFLVDGVLLGTVPIIRVDTPSIPTMKQELWYDADKMMELPEPVHYFADGRNIRETEAQDLLKRCRPRKT
jgi:hypothetical protein